MKINQVKTLLFSLSERSSWERGIFLNSKAPQSLVIKSDNIADFSATPEHLLRNQTNALVVLDIDVQFLKPRDPSKRRDGIMAWSPN